MSAKPFIHGVDNYQGFCVDAISKTSHDSNSKRNMILALPSSVSYDQYVGVVSICESGHDSNSKRNMILAMFS